MQNKQHKLSYLLFIIFLINFTTLVINLEDHSPRIKLLKPEEKIGYHPSLTSSQGDTILENIGRSTSGDSQFETSLSLSTDQQSNNPDLGGPRTKTQSDYSTLNWIDTRWRYRKNLTIDNTKVSADLTNFPMLVNLHDSDLRNDAQASGDDIFFTDDSGTRLDHEIESYNRVYNSTHAQLVAWVKTNLSGSQNTVISMYFGNPTAENQENPESVWGSDYKGVWHLSEKGTGTRYDSTSNNNDGTANNYDVDEDVTGQIDGADDFDGTDDFIDLGSDSSLNVTTVFTVEAWIKWDGTVTHNTIYSSGDTNGEYYQFAIENSKLNLRIDGVGNNYGATILSSGVWYHVAVVKDGDTGTNLFFYLDGGLNGSQSGGPVSATGDKYIGARAEGGISHFFNGSIDDVRFSAVARSGDWIATEYSNQYDPNSFYSTGAKENSPDIDNWAFDFFKHRKNITIDASQVNGSGSLTNFPILVSLSDTDLHEPEKVQPDGDDIIFTDINGTKLDHEIELFDQEGDGTHARLVAWVNIPSLSGTSNTTISMYYGNSAAKNQENPSGVWNDYTGVWHLGEDPTGTLYDSTANNNVGTSSGSMTSDDQVTGQIDGSLDFDGTDDYIDVGNLQSLAGSSGLTMSLWFYANTLPTAPGHDYGICIQHDDFSNQMGMRFDANGGKFIAYVEDGDVPAEISVFYTGNFVINRWYYAVLTFDSGVAEVFLNNTSMGTNDKSASFTTLPDFTNDMFIGSLNAFTDDYFDGIIDEVRVSDFVRSSDWIATEYNNQYDPDSFYSIDSEENSPIFSDWSQPLFRYKKTITINASEVDCSGGLDYDSIILLPSSAGYESSIDTETPLGGTRWQLLSDDDDSTYVEETRTTYYNDTYQVPDPTGVTGTNISSVTVYIRAKAITATGGEGATVLRTYNTNYEGTINSQTNTWTDYSTTYTNNPNTGSSWTWSEINSMEIGVMLKKTNKNPICSKIWAVVNYDRNATSSDSLIDFPVLVNLTDIDLQDLNKVQADGDDILFTDSSGMKLDHEIEYFNRSTGHLIAWVKVPSLSGTSDTNITIYYGNEAVNSQENPSGVWDNNYAGVWHLSESSGGNLAVVDSTTNANNGTDYGSVEFGATGKIDGAIGLNEYADYISISDSSSLDSPSNYITISAWTWAEYYQYSLAVLSKSEYTNSPYAIEYLNSTPIRYHLVGVTASSVNTGVTATREGWMYITLTYNGSHVNIYKDGSLAHSSSQSGTITSNDNPLLFGREETYGDWYKGLLDEIRISNSARSSGWITTEFNNQNDTSNFYSVGAEEVYTSWWADGSFSKRKDIVIDREKVSSDLEDFPVLVDLYDTDMHDTNKVQEDGDDIMFTDASGMKLDHEIELLNQTYNITHAHLVAWVRVPGLSSTEDTTISMYYGNNVLESQEFPEGVWDSNFVAVWHLNEGSGTVYDSTSYNNDGTPNGTLPSVDSKVGKAYDFTNGYISVNYSSSLDFVSGSMYIEAWVKYDAFYRSTSGDNNDPGIFVWHDGNTDMFGLGGTLDTRPRFRIKSTNIESGSNPNTGTWYYAVGRYTGSDMFIYHNLNQLSTTSQSGNTDFADGTNEIGARLVYNSNFLGIIDELRISKVDRGIDYMNTVYNNQYDSSSFYSVGSECVYDETPPVVKDYGVDDPGTGIGNFWAVISDTASDVISATIKINSTEHSMSNNGTHWIYQQSVNLTDYYTYQITNTSDVYGNNLTTATFERSYTFFQDSIAPTVVDWEYYAEQGLYGTFNANVSDAWGEIDTVIVNITNRVGKTAVMKNTTSGYINDTLVLAPGQIYFTIIVNDTGGNNFTSTEHNSIVPSFNNVPIAGNLTLSRDQATILLPVYSNSTLYLDYDYYDEDSDNETGTEIHWYKNGVLQSIHDDLATIAASNLFDGDQWNATVRPNDGIEFGDLVVSPLITIQNTAPEVTTVDVTPGSPGTSTNLTATYIYFDIDGDVENVDNREIEWFKNGQSTGLTTLTIDSSNTAKGENWSFKIRVHDGIQYSIWYQSANVTIVNTAPTTTSLNIVNAGNLRTTDDLIANWTFSDADGDSQVAYYILWYKNSLLQPSMNDSMIITAGNTSKDQSWSYKLVVNDGTINSSADWDTALASATIQVLNSSPEANGLTITTNPYTTDNLVVDWNYTDADNDGQTPHLLRWYKNGVLQPSLNDSKTVSSSLTSKGETWNYTLQVYDGEDYSIVYNSSSVSILNSVPTVSSLTITSNPYNTTNLVVSWTFNDDDTGDSQAEYIVYWYRDSVLQSHLDNKTTVEASNTTKGETWNYTVNVNDGESWSITYNSSTTTILNSIPTATGLNIENSGNLRTTDDLVANWTFSDLDADLQAAFYICWYKNGLLQPLLNNTKTVAAGNTSKDQSWYFTLVVHDGVENSTLYTLSPPVQILNAAPTATGVSITSNPNTTTQLVASWIFDDDDTGDVEISYLIRWYEGGILQPALNDSKTVASSLTSKGEEWNYTLQVFDGEDYSITYNSSTVTILNSVPTVSGLTITSNPYNTTDLDASWTFVDDDSGDNQADYYIHWYKDNALQTNLDNKTSIEAANTTKGEHWNFTLQVFDGENWSIIYNSSITEILNSAPTIVGTATFNKTTSVLETDTLNITYTYYDPDFDSEGSAIIYWYKNNASGSYYVQSKDNHTILYSTDTSDGDFWYYKIRVNDGITYSNNYTSIGVPINFVNGKPEALNVQIISGLYTTDDLVGNYVYSDPTENHSEAGTLYTWYWFNSSSGKYELQHAYNDTLTLPASATAKGDQWKFSVRPKDGLSYSDSWFNSSAVTILNTLPTASGLILTDNPYNTTNLVANWTFADIDADSQADYYIRWYKDNVLQSQLDNKTTIEAANTTKGEVWNYTLQVQDGEGWSTVYYSGNTTILNTVPTATSLTLTANPYTTTDLVADWTFSDPVDNDSQSSYLVLWYKNGELQVDLNDTKTVEASNTTKGENWKYTVRVYDGDAWSIIYISTTVTILNTVPEASSIDLTTNPSTTDDLGATWDYDDNDNDSQSSWLIRWYKDGVLQASLNDSTTVAASLTAKGEEWNYTLQVFDGSDHSIVYNSSTITILNSVPTASELTITSNPYNLTNLVTGWTFADNDTGDSQVSYEIHWYRDGLVQSQLDNKTAVEATNTTKGEVWNYTLRVHDGETYSIYYNSTTVTILNTLPASTGLNIENAGNIRTTDNLVANWTFNDLDLDSQDSFNICWYWNGILQGDLNDTKIVEAGNTTKGEFWKFTLQVHDGEEWSIIYTSTAISILNTAPEVSGVVTITATSFTRGNDLTVDYTYFDADNDQEIGTEIRWYKNNVLEPAYDDLSTIPGSDVFKGDDWNVTVKVGDGSFQGTLASSIAYTILNTAPVVTSGTILYTGDLTTESTLGTSYDTTDADGDGIVDFQVIWWVDNVTGTYEKVLSLENLTILTPASTLKDQLWKFDVRVFDGDGWSDYYNASFVTIQNTPPQITNVTLSGGSTTDEDITITYVFIDPDNDSDAGTTIVWQVLRGVTLLSGFPPGSTLASSNIQAGDLVFCFLTPNDGDDVGSVVITSVNSPDIIKGLVIVGNTAPVLTNDPVIIGPNGSTDFYGSENLYINYSAINFAYDRDGDDVPGSIYDIENKTTDGFSLVTGSKYEWYKNGFLMLALKDPFVDSQYLSRGDNWKVRVSISDRYGYSSPWYESPVITINNSLPEIQGITWITNTPTTIYDLVIIDYHYHDFDNDPEGMIKIEWFINGINISINENQTILSHLLFDKGDNISVIITPHDGELYGIPYNSSISEMITVMNALPNALAFSIENSSFLQTNNDLVANWTFYDVDGDHQVSYTIRWYRNGILQPNLNDSLIVGAGNTSKSDSWYFTLQVYDGEDNSILYHSDIVLIFNSQMVINEVLIDVSGDQVTTTAHADDILTASVDFTDPDGDIIPTNYFIYWYVNGSFREDLGNKTITIASSYLAKGQAWYCIYSISDDEGSWSANKTSRTITIVNKQPVVMSIEFIFEHVDITPFNDSREFVLDDEALRIDYVFVDVDNDADQSLIAWYYYNDLENQFILQDQFTNMTVVPANVTSPGETWRVVIIPNDGDELGTQIISINITIESRPVIHDLGFEPRATGEGAYHLWVQAADERRTINQVKFDITVIELNYNRSWALFTTNGTPDTYAWEDFDLLTILRELEGFDEADFASLMSTTVTVQVTVYTDIIGHVITSSVSFNFTIEDNAPPRVTIAGFSYDQDNPMDITFYALLQDHGSGVDEVILYYDFVFVEDVNTTNGNGASNSWRSKYLQVPSFPNSVLLTDNGTHYFATVPFNPNGTTDIFYRIQAADISGNINNDAYPAGHDPLRVSELRYRPTITGLSLEQILPLVFVLIIAAAIISFVAIKKFSSTELVGIDLEKVLENIQQVSEEEIDLVLDQHTLGLVVSYFDQRHGPIPIIVEPEILKDNFEKLTELSDLSFSACRFIDNFEEELPSHFDYIYGTGLRTTSVSWGYALERPDARGGAENITLNLLVYKTYSELLLQFLGRFSEIVHDIHVIMDKSPEKKEEITKRIVDLRRLVSSILLSYESMYGPVEESEEEK
ncbi:MAG: DUF2341 domain-containing protein [Candidatus Hodarchaeales archaeon]|jgi:hypothetical protein